MVSAYKQILVIDDDHLTRTLVVRILENAGYKVLSAESGSKGLNLLNENKKNLPLMIFMDVMMPQLNGFETLGLIRENNDLKNIPVIFITATEDQSAIHKCFEVGGADYISKPIRENELLNRMSIHLTLQDSIDKLDEIEQENLNLRNKLLNRNLQDPKVFEEIITISKDMHGIFQYIESISPSSRPVFITGETGVGKELIAKATHALSHRDGEFIPLNVAGLDDNLFSDTLFGHVAGAFTGAVGDRPGLIEKAVGGTLFLDEIGDLDPLSQVKLLRLLQEGEYYPLGADQRKWSDTRIVVATHKNIQELVDQGTFRQDLFYRLKTHHIHIPPLRERKCDLTILLDHFLIMASKHLQRKAPQIPQTLMPLLESYNFPGNIRELESMIFDAVSRSSGYKLSIEAIQNSIRSSGQPMGFSNSGRTTDTIVYDLEEYLQHNFPSIKEMTNMLIEKALERSNGNQSLAAQLLGISRQALNKRLKRSNEIQEDNSIQSSPKL
ncbi:MAG: sigma-54-dependent Fis family transcriptional regulator [Lentisphaeria bacterium]|nr:sigma-54 dependent transcriptional regulator [Lentisphaeria bacterium]NQZ67167.1 sigma-54-dependent Fis family transcriptional regulator [Lentisphaeria bacterium]